MAPETQRMTSVEELGWGGNLYEYLHHAVMALTTSKVLTQRLELATQQFIFLSEDQFPDRLREVAGRVKSARLRVEQYGNFYFARMGVKERSQLIEDIVNLWTEYVFDHGKANEAYILPTWSST